MQMHLDTIPLWDNFRAGGECPLCTLSQYLEEQFLDITLGGAAMEPDIRIMSNEKGYCARHFKALFDRQQRLPLALITHTHLTETVSRLKPLMEAAMPGAEPVKRGLFAGKGAPDPTLQLLDQLEQTACSCMICQRVASNMERYQQTCASLYHKDPSFAALYRQGQGFCLPHFASLLRLARGELKGKAWAGFLSDTLSMEQAALERLEGELKHFTTMFDYRNAGADWGSSRDALPRVIAKLRGASRPDEG